MSRRQHELKNTQIFNSKGHGPGVWTGQGVTRTKRSRTLFVTVLPNHVQPAHVGALFKKEPGYEDFRSRRRMCFVDFDNPIHATSAMRKFQGYKFKPSDAGLAIDYDKDHVSKRNKQYERQKRKRQEADDITHYFCSCCGQTFLSLKGAPPMDTMKKRKTDGATAVKEMFLGDLYARRAGVKKIKRTNGIERQYPLLCTKCNIPIAYRPVPLTKQSKFLYILPDALSDDPTQRVSVATAAADGAGEGAGASPATTERKSVGAGSTAGTQGAGSGAEETAGSAVPAPAPAAATATAAATAAAPAPAPAAATATATATAAATVATTPATATAIAATAAASSPTLATALE